MNNPMDSKISNSAPARPLGGSGGRQITEIIIHCSATEAGQDFGAADIDRWHRARGWQSIGYHYVVRLDGRIEVGRPESEVGAHCAGHNAHSIGICYIGGLHQGQPADTRTAQQKAALTNLITHLHTNYPDAVVLGHRDTGAPKACPCFDVRKEFPRE